jgi:tetratricopeptide (TPR) repeat protein
VAAAAVACVVLAAGGRAGTPAQRSVTGLTAAPRLAQAYDAIFDARFEELPGLLASVCGPAPAEACALLDALSTWWQIQLDPNDRSRDQRFQQQIDDVIAATDRWTDREPQRAEAWFYRGAAYGARVQWRVLRGARLAAARDGKRIKDALERALTLDPGLSDAYVGLGLYHYYADVAPAAARVLRWLLLLPGGDRTQGLREIARGRAQGALLRSEAEYQLHVLDLWYEKQPERALTLLEGLHDRHPANPHFLQLQAEVEDVYMHDPTSSLRAYERLLAAARSGALRRRDLGDTAGRLGAARQLDVLFETDAAIERLDPIARRPASPPFGSLASAHVQLGEAYDRVGRREDALAAYRAGLAAVPPGDPLRTAERARRGLRVTPNAESARAYHLALEGRRALQRKELDDASRLIAESLAIRPRDPVTRYLQAQLLQARGDDAGALAVLDPLLVTRDGIPPTIYASGCMDAARIHEAQGTLEQAAALYRTAVTVFGIDRRMKDAAERALVRLNAVTAAPR